MVKFIQQPTIIQAAGNLPKRIEEYVGLVNTGTPEVSIAKMISPTGWIEPGQTPKFTEYTVVLQGILHLKTKAGEFDVAAGATVEVEAGSWVQYSTPHEGGAEYLAVCVPAFSPKTVNRDDECPTHCTLNHSVAETPSK